jgi:hypothetical protein
VKASRFVVFKKYYWGDQTEEVQIGETCIRNRDIRSVPEVLVGKLHTKKLLARSLDLRIL